MPTSIYKFYDNLLKRLNVPSDIKLCDVTNELVHTNFNFFHDYMKININVINNIQYGGFVYHYTYDGKLYRFNINVEEEDDRTTYAIYNKEEMVCMMLFIPKKEHYVYIETISSHNGCTASCNPKTKIGTLILLATLDLIKKKLKSMYELKYVQLKDNSLFYCKKTKNTIEFDSVYMLSRGDTWYGKYGFKPNGNDLKIYENNQKIVNSVKMKKTKFVQYLNNLLSKEKIDKIYDMYKEKTIKEFFYDLTKHPDQTCDVIGKIYEDLMRDNGIVRMHGKSYYLLL